MDGWSKLRFFGFQVLPTLVALGFGVSLFPVPANAAMGFGKRPEPVEVHRVGTGPLSVRAGGTTTLRLEVSLEEGWHVNARSAGSNLIALAVDLGDSPLVVDRWVEYPEPVEYKFPFSDEPLLVHEGSFQVPVVLRVAPEAEPGLRPFIFTVRYQACSKNQCLRPRTSTGRFPIDIRSRSRGTTRKRQE